MGTVSEVEYEGAGARAGVSSGVIEDVGKGESEMSGTAIPGDTTSMDEPSVGLHTHKLHVSIFFKGLVGARKVHKGRTCHVQGVLHLETSQLSFLHYSFTFHPWQTCTVVPYACMLKISERHWCKSL